MRAFSLFVLFALSGVDHLAAASPLPAAQGRHDIYTRISAPTAIPDTPLYTLARSLPPRDVPVRAALDRRAAADQPQAGASTLLSKIKGAGKKVVSKVRKKPDASVAPAPAADAVQPTTLDALIDSYGEHAPAIRSYIRLVQEHAPSAFRVPDSTMLTPKGFRQAKATLDSIVHELDVARAA